MSLVFLLGKLGHTYTPGHSILSLTLEAGRGRGGITDKSSAHSARGLVDPLPQLFYIMSSRGARTALSGSLLSGALAFSKRSAVTGPLSVKMSPPATFGPQQT